MMKVQVKVAVAFCFLVAAVESCTTVVVGKDASVSIASPPPLPFPPRGVALIQLKSNGSSIDRCGFSSSSQSAPSPTRRMARSCAPIRTTADPVPTLDYF